MDAKVPGFYFTRAPRAAEPSPLRSDVAGFIGRTRRGPVGVAVRVEGWREYVRIFGDLAADALTTYAVRGYFENGGQVAYVVRLAEADGVHHAGAQWDVRAPVGGALPVRPAPFLFDRYAVAADSPGAWANGTRVAIRYRRDALSGPAQLDVSVAAPGEPVADLVGAPLTWLEPTDEAPLPVLRAGLVLITPQGAPPAALPGAGPQRMSWQLVLGGGDDGPTVAAPAYAAALAALGEAEEVALVCLPDLCHDLGSDSERRDVLAAALDQAAASKDRLVMLDLPDADAGPGDSAHDAGRALEWLGLLRAASEGATLRAGAAYHPWVSVQDPFGGIAAPLRPVPPSGHVAGLISRLDRARGPHYTPANAALSDALDVTQRFGREAQARLYLAGINLLMCFAGRGLQVWGARTLSADPASRFIAHRRLIHRLVRAIRRVTAPLVFDTNGPELWLTIVRAVTTVLLEAWRNGALQGARPDEAFRVRCDASTTTAEERDLGLVFCDIELAPAAPMEFILLRIALGAEGKLEVFEP